MHTVKLHHSELKDSAGSHKYKGGKPENFHTRKRGEKKKQRADGRGATSGSEIDLFHAPEPSITAAALTPDRPLYAGAIYLILATVRKLPDRAGREEDTTRASRAQQETQGRKNNRGGRGRKRDKIE